MKKIVLLCVFLVGCASVGNEYDRSAIDAFVPGETTIEQAIQLAGKPTSKSIDSMGNTLLQWQHSNVVYTSSKGTHDAVLFDADGKMKRIFLQTETNLN